MNKDFKLDKKNIENIFDLTALQEGMLFHYLNSTKSNIYCAQLSLEIDGLIIKDYFQEAWNKVIENNEMLRIVFRWEKLSKPIQIILKEINVDIRYCDITGKESSVIDTDIQDIKLKDYTEGFDLREVPFRLTLCKLNNNKYNLLISNHHILYDGWSNGIILNEFLHYYHKQVIGSNLQIHKKTSFNEYVKLNKELTHEGKAFWKDYLNGYEVNSVFRSKTNNLLSDKTNECYKHLITEDKVQLLKRYCELHRLTIADILYNAWGILLSKYSGIEDILFGTTVSGRNIKLDGIEKMVGLFINTIPLRLILPTNKPLIEIIKENAIHLRERGSFENVPLQEILNSSGFKGDELFESIFVIENYPIDKESLKQNDELAFTSFSIKETTNYKLTVSAFITDEIEINLNYNNASFENDLIERIGKHYVRIVDWIINEKESDIISLDILTEEEKHQLLYEFNNTQADYPKDKTIHQLFEEQVERTPENEAVCCDGNILTYNELNRKANIIAHHIQEIGIDRDDIVTIFLDRSIETVFSMLGVLKSGGAYLPLDPDYPDDRIDFILNDCRSKILITTKDLSTRIEFDRNIIYVEDLSVLEDSFSNIESINKPSDLSYIIYTSGTTGNPKGVMVEHRNAVRLFFNDKFQFDFSEKDVWTMFHSHCFDFSVWEMYGALLYGGKLIVIPKIVSRDVDKYYKLLREEKVTVLNQTPSAFYNLLEIALLNPDKSLENLRYVIFGGEALKPNKLAEWFNIYSDVKLINMYGITETTVHVTYKEIGKYEIENNISNIGKPIPTLTTYVVDNNLRLVPKGVAGELLIGGDGVSRGYLGREDLTRDRFIKNPYNEEERLYRSGDLVKMLSNGELEYLGRIDDQVQLRGFRIELGEIESTILKYGEVKEVAVIDRKDTKGDNYLCAYVVGKKELNFEILRSYLAGILPEYMIPSYFVELENIPLTSNGKIDKKAFPEPEIKASGAYVAPKTLIESKLVKIWSEVLNVTSKEISTNASFFELGGHSLKATVLVSRIHKELDVRIELRDVFQYQTIQAQSELINSSESSIYLSIPKAKKQDYYPLSSSQRRLYLLQQMDLGSIAYNMPGLIAVPKGQNRHQITEVFNKLIARHENFRTSFEVENDLPVQRIHTEVPFSIEEYQITQAELSGFRNNFVQAFDLSVAPLIRVAYLEVVDGEDMLIFDIHHIISDGRSHAILEEDFSQLLSGKELEPLHLQYKDYSQWQNSKKQQERIKGQETYWLDKFTGELPVLELPTDYSRPIMQSLEGASVGFILSEEEIKIIHDLSKEQGLTLYMSLLSIFTILLSKLSGQEDIIVGSPIAARRHADLEDVVGMFVNTLAIRSDVSGEKQLIDYLQELKENTLEAYENQEYQFEDLVEQLVINRDVGRNPLFDVMFNLLEGESQESTVSVTEELKHIPGVSKFDLSLTALDLGSELQLSFSYNTTLFSSETIERFINYFRHLIQSLSSNLDQTIKELNILSDVEKQQLLYGFNQTKAIYPHDRCIHELIEEQVESSPDSIALVFKNQTLSYRELNLKSNQLAKLLLSKGLQPGDIVGILLDRSIEMIIGILGILKAGGAYLPMDPEYPKERINYIIRESGLFIILSQVSSYKNIEFEGEFLDLYDLSLYVNNKTGNINKGKASDSAYIIYTSGSTGKPKGVIIDHKNIVNLVNGLITNIYNNYQEILHVSLISPIFFDASVKQIFTSLTLGHSLNIIPKSIRFEASELVIHYAKYGIQILDGTPFHAQMLIQCDDEKLQGLSIKQFILGGDELKLELMQSLFLKLGIQDLKISNVYGPTECTDVTTVQTNTFECLNQNTSVSIGKPISNYEIYILGKEGQIKAIGLFGELCISGEGLARGYLNNPELTLEKFIEHPYKTGEHLYKTGDLARWLPNGDIEFSGRIDQQVKIRGFRIELEEIENILLKHVSITECVVLAIEENGDKYLCAYVVCENEFIQEKLRNYLSGLLPDYMIPSYFVLLDSIPLTSNGKIDRKSLPSPEIKAGGAYIAPKTLIESKLVKIWSEVLSVATKEISTNVSFFELGGHSLKATVLVSRIHKELDVRIELRDVFQYQTIQAQSELINSSESSIYLSIPKAKKQDYYPLSSSQRRLYLLQQMDLGSIAYNMPGLIAVPKGQNRHQITEVFNKLIARHENFRTSFEVENEIPVQRIHSEVSFSIKEYQITNSELSKVREDFIQAFDLSEAPLLRVGYLEISDGDDMLLIDMHHIISDGRSHSILEEEFYQLIAGKDLEPLGLQYKDYSEWQNSEEQQERIKGQESYWLDKFAGELPVLELPIDYSRPLMQDFEGASVGFKLSEEEAKIFHDLSKEQGLTLYMSLLSVFTILLSKLSGQEDIIIGSPIAARRHSDLDYIVGMFVNTLAMRNNVSGDKRLIDYLQELKENTLEAYENQEYQFEDLVDKVVENRDTSRNPLFDVMFNLLNQAEYSGDISGIDNKNLIHAKGVSKFDLTLMAIDYGEQLLISFEYSTKLFKPETIERFINYFRVLLQSLSGNYQQKIKDLNILSEEEKQQLLYEFNNTESDYPNDKTILQLFEDQVMQTPENTALVSQNESLTYSELNKKSNELAHYLFKKGASEQNFIAVVNDSSVKTYVGILGILRIGKAYLPIDSTLPDSRIHFMLEDCGIKTILSSNDQNSFINNSNKQFDIVNVEEIKISNSSDLNLLVHSASPVYVIYTSGSTGNPKGVVVEHKSLVNLCLGHNKFYGVESKDRSGKYAGFGFDASVWEFFPIIIAGASLYIVDENIKLDPEKVNNYFEENKITISFLPTQFCEKFMKYDNKSLRILLTGGDKLNSYTKRDYKLFNNYGPTENTVVTTRFEVKKQENNIPIGKPIENNQVYILGKNNQVQPIGVSGELFISGYGLSEGYLNNPELTSEKFIIHPFKEGEKLYRTGDLARWLADGNIEFLGRIDHQVKIRGFRIELGEIESTLLKHLDVTDALVLSREDSTGDKYLCSYIVSNSQENNLEESLRKHLSGLLPDYMIPSYFVELEKIPLTSNGKIDWKLLPAPEIKAGVGYVAPKTLIESKLVKIWSEVLNVTSKEISTNASFFELGGHSLKATVLVSRIHKELDVRIELRDVFQYQTIQAQSELINSSESSIYLSIPKAKKQDYYPLSSSQRRLYLLQQMDLGSIAYNMPGLIAVPKGQNRHQITEVFNKLIARHENFRTSFEVENDLPVQRIHTEVPFSIEEYQITQAELSGFRNNFVQAFDLSVAPLIRVAYLEVVDGEDMLIFDIHHIISDGRSHAILEEDFSQLLSGKELEPLHLQYKDYSQWQNSKKQQERIKGQETYWLDKFTGELPVLELPTDYSRPIMQSLEGASVGFILSEEEIKIIHDLSKEQGLTLYMSLLSIFTILLSKLSGQEDIIVGSPIAARRHADLEDVVGMFVNTLAIRSDVSGEKQLIDYLQELKENTLEAYENQEYQFEDLVEQLVINRDVGRNPLFDVMFNLLEGESQESTVSVTEELKHIPGVSKFDLSLTALDLGSELQLSFSYNTTLFSSETIERFINYFRHLIQSLSSNLDQTIKELNILSDVEKQQLLYGFNQTKAIYPHDRCIHELIEEQVESSPDSIALVFKNQTLSYRELNLKSNQLAKLLLSKGLQPGDIVGILLDRSIEMIIGILGILKAGGAYLPMDPEYPKERINYIIRESGLFIILSQVSSYKNIEFEGEFLDLYDLSLYVNNKTGNINKGKASDSAYIIYTSGSTGKPKGVIIDHKNIVNLVNGLITNIYNNYQEILHVSLISPIFFDASVKQIFTSLTLGHSLNIIPKSIRFEASELVIHYAKYGIQILDGTPFHAQMLIQCDDEKLQGLSIKQFILGGDELKLELMQSLFLKLGIQDLKISNVYGPTECTDVTTVQTNTFECLNQNTSVSIGKPISNYEIYILGKEGQIKAIGLFGELCISGEGLARGYLNNPELTLEKFIEHPYKTGEHLYKTGDLARWLPNGDIEFSGRIDQQVKIRGFRIELEEIENILLKHVSITECVVLAIEENGDKYLCAYVVCENEFIQEKLRNYLSGLLPDYMIPSYFVLLDSIPLTSNGKIDRKSLPSPEIKAGGAYIAPKTLIESKLVKIWSEVLSVATKEISTNVSFFELGGHSLKATVLVSRIHKELDVRIELRDVFQYQTIQAQSELINSSESSIYLSIPKAKKQDYYPLSSSQRRLYLLQQMDLGSIAYNMPGLIAVPKGQNRHQITEVFNKLIARHENFRTSFEVENEIPVQRIHSEVSFSIKEYQITNSELSKVREDFIQAFDLSEAPLLRVGYLEISDGDDMLLIDMHHIISDGRSHSILEEEFYQLIAGKDLEPLGLQYKDYSEWQNSEEQQERIKGQESYWLDKFAGELPVLELPIDYSRPLMQDFEGASVGFKLSEEEAKIFHDLSKEQGLTLYMSLLSVFTILLSKLSGQEDIIIGSPIAARRHSDLDYIVGMFVNTLAMRNNVSGDKRLIDYLQELKENTLEAYENQEYQFEDLVDKVVENRDTSRNPLFDVMFNLLEGESQEVKDSSKEDLIHTQGISKFDLSLTVLDLGSEIQLSFEYSTKLFKTDTIERFINYFRQLIQSISVNQEQKIKALNILPEEEKQQLLYHFNDTKRDYPKDKTIHQLFEEQVERTPDHIALNYNDQIITYRELNSRSNQLGQILLEKGVNSEGIVGLLVDRSIEMLIGILGILKSGGAYLPIDPSHPESRIKYILENSNSQLILCSEIYRNKIDLSFHIFLLEEGIFTKDEKSNLDIPITPTNLCYVIYTSGSTGTPKGVNVEHLSVLNLLYFLQDKYPIRSNDSYLLKTSYCFDVSVSELFGWIQGGGKLCILETGQENDAVKIIETINKLFVTHINFVPSVFNSFSESIPEINKNKLISLRYILLAGEALLSEHLKMFKYFNLDVQIDNLYGPTEATVFASYYSLDLDEVGSVSIGRPLSNYEIFILDKNMKLQPLGVSGELLIGGKGLARNYLNNPELTSEKFIDHPFKEGEKLYKTGDLARWLPDGNVEFLGRLDQQVKIRGFRIELGEIENTLLRYKNIKESVVLVWGQGEDKYLCAYVVVEEAFNKEEIRNYLSEHLPNYMLPSYFVALEKIPLTSNGKIDRKSLPVPEIKAGSGYVAPQTLIETKLVKIWSEVLNVSSKEISTNISFFELGGHSLKATVLVSRIHKELDVRLELRDVFQSQTIQSQSELINLSETTSYFSIPKAKTQEYYPLSSSQRRLYLLQQMDIGSIAYNMHGLIAVPKGQNKNQITDVFHQLIARHENFRTSFDVENDLPVQRIHSEVAFSIKEYQITKFELSNIKEDFVKAFDLSQAPLLRVGYLEISDGDDMLLIDMHHIISDGRSHSILEEEFYQLIAGKDLEPLGLQYKDYSEWQNSSEQQSRIKGQESYWLDQFAGELPVLELPIDYSRPVMQDFEGASVGFKLSEEETKIIHDLSKEQGLTLYMSLLSVFTVLLSKLSGQDDIVIGSPIAARRHADLEDVVGMFVNTLAMRNNVSGDKRLIDYLQEIKENTLGAYENQEYQFEDLVEEVVKERNMSRNPLFDVMFNYEDGEFPESIILNEEEFQHIKGISKFDLSLTAIYTGSGIELLFEYSTKLFRPETIDRFIGYFKELVQSFSGNSVRTISELNILSEEEKQQLLYEFNDTQGFYPKDKTIHQLFEEQVERTPNKIAITKGEECLSYQELNRRANQLASYCRIKGAVKESKIGLVSDHSMIMLIGMLGILKSGGCYVPIDSSYPEERIDFIVEDAEIGIILLSHKVLKTFSNIEICIDLEGRSIYHGKGINLENINETSDLSYIIYTSGSTGRPKGVMVEHRNVVSYIYSFQEEFKLNSRDIVMQQASISFDTFVEEVYPILVQGGKLAIIKKQDLLDLESLGSLIKNYNITVISCSPLLLNEINVFPAGLLNNVRLFISGGDELRYSYIDNLIVFSRVYNTYGPTEATVCSLYYECDRNKVGNIPIGSPIMNSSVLVVGKNLELLPIGVAGELCIGGAGLSRGYINNRKLTSEKFIAHSYIEGERLYKTGDLARRLPDGNIEFLGRIDHQVKIRGFRVELGEIENNILNNSAVQECTVMCREDQGGDKYLCAYVVCQEEFNKESIRSHLSGILPDYMIPSYFVEIEKIPLNSNGKVDRKTLPAPEIKSGEAYEAPKTLIESKLVKIWSEVLNITSKEISTNVSFFELGGHSLKISALISRIYEEFNVRISFKEIFRFPTINKSMEFIRKNMSVQTAGFPIAEKKKYYQTSVSQETLFTIQSFINSTAYNIYEVVTLKDNPETEILEYIFNSLLKRHDSLRTSFEIIDNKLHQIIHDEIKLKITEIHIDDETIIKSQINKFIKPFDIKKAPLIEVGLIRCNGKSMMIVNLHHIICDGLSMYYLAKEFMALYSGYSLKKMRFQYKDYTEWSLSKEFNGKLKEMERYWIDQFKSFTSKQNLPFDFPLNQNNGLNKTGNSENTSISGKLYSKIMDFCKNERISQYTFFMTCVNILLYKIGGNTDVIVGSIVAGRELAEFQRVIGNFVNMIAIRNYPNGNKSISDFLLEVHDSVFNGFKNSDYRFEKVLNDLDIKRGFGENPLTNVGLSYHDFDIEGDIFIKNEKEGEINDFAGNKNLSSRMHLNFNVYKRFSEYKVYLEYDSSLFLPQSILSIIKNYNQIIEYVIDGRENKIDMIDIDINKNSILEDLNSSEINIEFGI